MAASKQVTYEISGNGGEGSAFEFPFIVHKVVTKTFKTQTTVSRYAVAGALTKKMALAIVNGLTLDESMGKPVNGDVHILPVNPPGATVEEILTAAIGYPPGIIASADCPVELPEFVAIEASVA